VEQKLVFENIYPFSVIFFIGLGAFILSFIAYVPAFRRWATEWVAFLVVLRTFAIIVLLLGFIKPVVEKKARISGKTSVAVLVDVSRSMLTQDCEEGKSRIQALKDSLLDNRLVYDILRNSCRVREYLFGGSLEGLESPLLDILKREVQMRRTELDATRPQTSIGNVLGQCTTVDNGASAHLIILMSDGVSNAGDDPVGQAMLLSDLGAQIFTVGYGLSELSGASRDISALDIRATKKVPEGGYLAVKATFSVIGFPDRHVAFDLQIEGETVKTRREKIKEASQFLEMEFKHRPSAPGFQKVTVVAQKLPGEVVEGNNDISTYTEVISGRIPVLYIEGRLRFEYKFLKRLLKETEGLIVDERLVSKASLGRGGLLPETRDDWRRYKAVIVGDVPAEVFSAESLEGLKEAVSSGMGFMMIGGLYNFTDPKYKGTAMEEILPVILDSSAGQINEPLKLVPERGVTLPPMLKLSDDEQKNLSLWKDMPPLDGLVTVAGAKRGAEVLASCAWEDYSYPVQPVFLRQHYGAGRSAALLVDSTWRWAMEGRPASDRYKQFWIETVLWLAGSDLPAKGEIQIIIDDYRVKRSSAVDTEILVSDGEGNPITDVQLDGTLISPDQSLMPLRPRLRDGSYRVSWTPEKVGDYRISFSATRDGKPVAEGFAKVVSYEEDKELKHIPADFFTLRQIAEKSGGRFYDSSKLGELLAMLSAEKAQARITVPVKIQLWNSVYACILFVGLLALEWFIRRRLGMA